MPAPAFWHFATYREALRAYQGLSRTTARKLRRFK